jgi:hypothetical protein
MVKFKFKRINQEMTPRYRPPVPVADSSAGGTAHPERPQTLLPACPITSARAGTIAPR